LFEEWSDVFHEGFILDEDQGVIVVGSVVSVGATVKVSVGASVGVSVGWRVAVAVIVKVGVTVAVGSGVLVGNFVGGIAVAVGGLVAVMKTI
jgi:hypothetical protein